jgi:N-sulfoglucosamine sulfohydrolase
MKNHNLGVFSVLLASVGCHNADSNLSEELLKLNFKPNILWISCEDITPALGCYGDSAANTPNLDKLASEGIRYTNAYSVAGVSAPSRCGIITGMYPTSIGGHNMRTTWIGKQVGDSLGLPERYSIVPPVEVKCFSEYLRAEGYYCTNNRKTDYQFFAPFTAWDECSTKAHYRNRKPGQPFFAIFNFLTTHESRIWMQGGEPLLVDYNKVSLPPYYPENPVIRQDVARKYSNIAEMDRQVGIMLEELEQSGLMDSTIIVFFSDHGGMLPREKRELYDTGLKIPLLIRYPKKLFAGKVTDELVSFVDFAPTMLSIAGIDIPKYMQGKAFLGDQKSEARSYIYGARDRMDGHYDMVRAVRDKRFKYLKNYKPELPFVQNIQYRKQIPMMNVLYEYDRQDKFEGVQKLWWRDTKPREELYDCKNDPFEFNNLAEDPAYKEKLEELRGALKAWQDKYGDLGFIPETELVERFWSGKIQPKTDEVIIEKIPTGIQLSCKTKGASIGYQVVGNPDPEHWYLYTEPINLQPGETLKAIAIRIGYAQSDTLTYVMQ